MSLCASSLPMCFVRTGSNQVGNRWIENREENKRLRCCELSLIFVRLVSIQHVLFARVEGDFPTQKHAHTIEACNYDNCSTTTTTTKTQTKVYRQQVSLFRYRPLSQVLITCHCAGNEWREEEKEEEKRLFVFGHSHSFVESCKDRRKKKEGKTSLWRALFSFSLSSRE